jgi:hypothetical protein
MRIVKLLVVALLISLASSLTTNADVAVNSTSFPDANFLAYVKTLAGASDGTLTDAEITAIASMDCSNMNIKTLTGIDNFKYLKTLKCNDNHLTSIDLSGNSTLYSVNLDNNNLNSINLSKFGGWVFSSKTMLVTNNGRTIKVYSYTRGSGYSGTDKVGYYVPLNDQNDTINGLATLIYNARNFDFDSQDSVSGGAFNLSKVVPGSWEGATLGTFNGIDVLFLDKTTVGANANLHRFTYVYSTDIKKQVTPTGIKGKLPSALKVAAISPSTLKFYLDWSEKQVVSSVDNIAGGTAKVYSINGTIHVVGAIGNVNVYNLRGQQVYIGNGSEIVVPAGMYVVKVDGTVHKVMVK